MIVENELTKDFRVNGHRVERHYKGNSFNVHSMDTDEDFEVERTWKMVASNSNT